MMPYEPPPNRHHTIRVLFDEYIEQYACRDDRLLDSFSEDFSGFAGGGTVLIKNREDWLHILQQDFSQVPGRLQIHLLDVSLQDLSDQVVVVTAFFNIHLPVPEVVFAKEVVRLVLIYRLEAEQWKIAHTSFSVPYPLVTEGEVYPLKSIHDRNKELEILVEERTRELNEREAFYRLLTEDTQDVIWKANSDLCITYISPSDEHLRGFKAEEVVGHHVFELFNHEGIAIVTKALQERKAAERSGNPLGFVNFEAPHRCKDGHVIWGEVFSKAVRDEHGKITGFHGITREITKRKELQDQIKQLAFYDALTQLPNRRLLVDRLNQALALSQRSKCFGAVMFVDLDNFKPLNDVYGHHAGDLLLIEVAHRLTSCVRDVDTVARFGGDEFVILLNDLDSNREKSIAYAAKVAEKIRLSLSRRYQLKVMREGEPETVIEHQGSASIGVYVYLDHFANIDDILRGADAAMYQAKTAGRNTVRMYKAESATQL